MNLLPRGLSIWFTWFRQGGLFPFSLLYRFFFVPTVR